MLKALAGIILLLLVVVFGVDSQEPALAAEAEPAVHVLVANESPWPITIYATPDTAAVAHLRASEQPRCILLRGRTGTGVLFAHAEGVNGTLVSPVLDYGLDTGWIWVIGPPDEPGWLAPTIRCTLRVA